MNVGVRGCGGGLQIVIINFVCMMAQNQNDLYEVARDFISPVIFVDIT